MATPNDYLTTSEASQLLQVTRFTVLNWIKQGKLQSVTTLGGHQRIPKEVLTTFIQKTKLANQTKFKDKEQFICCWESKEIIESGRHDCANCLVFKQKANRCFLSVRNFGSLKVECGHDCLNCGYFTKYYPEEKKSMESLCSKSMTCSESKASGKNRVVVDGLLNKISYNSGKCIANITHKLSKPKPKILKKDVKNNERRN